MTERTGAGSSRLPSVRIGAAVAVAIAIAFVAWFFIRENNDSSSTSATTTSSIGPTGASQDRLRALAEEAGHPIYWAGAKNGMTYELTRTTNGRVFVRYLPSEVPVGIRQAEFTIVGTYPVPSALKVLRELAKKPGETTFPAPHNGFAVYDKSHPTNVYVAYPGSDLQIEVFDPSAEHARELITSGAVAPVG
jgi:hypothetical protein